jgi:hypothetical protein
VGLPLTVAVVAVKELKVTPAGGFGMTEKV